MPIFTPKERREHANAVGYRDAPVKADSKYTEEEQRAYNRGVADVLNDQAMRYVLGKNSPLSAEEKAQIKAENKAMRKATPIERAKIKAERQARVAAKKMPAKSGGRKK